MVKGASVLRKNNKILEKDTFYKIDNIVSLTLKKRLKIQQKIKYKFNLRKYLKGNRFKIFNFKNVKPSLRNLKRISLKIKKKISFVLNKNRIKYSLYKKQLKNSYLNYIMFSIAISKKNLLNSSKVFPKKKKYFNYIINNNKFLFQQYNIYNLKNNKYYQVSRTLFLSNSKLTKKIFYKKTKGLCRVTILLQKNTIYGIIANKKGSVKYWCTPKSLKLIKSKKAHKYNLEVICEELRKRVLIYKYSKLLIKYIGKFSNYRKVLSFFKKDNLYKKILKLEYKIKFPFNGCRLSKKKRKKRHLKVNFINSKKLNYYQKWFNVYNYNRGIFKYLKENSKPLLKN